MPGIPRLALPASVSHPSDYRGAAQAQANLPRPSRTLAAAPGSTAPVGALQRPGSIASMTPASATEDRMQSNSKRDVLAPSHDAPAQPSTSTSPAAFCTVASPVLHWRIEQSRQSCDGASCDGASCVRKQRAVFCKRRAMVPIRKTCAVQFDNAIPIVPQSQSILSRDGWS